MTFISDYILLGLRKREVMKNIGDIQSSLLDVCYRKNCSLIKTLYHRYKNNHIEFNGIDAEVNNTNSDNIILKKSMIKSELPYKSNRFNMVVMMACLEHLEHPKNILKEAYRILEPNGKIIITTPTNNAEKVLNVLIKLNLPNWNAGCTNKIIRPPD